MADVLDSLESLADANTAAAETVPLRTSRKDVRMILKGSINGVGEGTLKSKSTLDFLIVLEGAGLALGIIAAHTSAVIGAADLHASCIAFARIVTNLADTHVKELVGKSLAGDLADHTVNAEDDLRLSLESSTVLLSGLTLIEALGKTIRNEVLRDSSLILGHIEATLLGADSVGVLEETEEGEVLEAKITILAGLGGALLGSIVVGILEESAELSLQATSDKRFDPAMRPARSDIGVELGILKTGIRRRGGRSRGGDVDVLWEVLFVPHGTRIASRHEEDESLEHLLGGHSSENLGEIAVVEELISGHSNETRVTVIIIEDEDVILSSRLENLATATNSRFTRKSIDKVLDGSIVADVILDDTVINIDVGTTLNIEFVVDLAGERISRVVSDIILEEGDDALIRNTSLMSKLISLAHGGLVTIVHPTSATSNQNNPGITTLSLAGLNSLLEHFVLLIRECNRDDS